MDDRIKGYDEFLIAEDFPYTTIYGVADFFQVTKADIKLIVERNMDLMASKGMKIMTPFDIATSYDNTVFSKHHAYVTVENEYGYKVRIANGNNLMINKDCIMAIDEIIYK